MDKELKRAVRSINKIIKNLGRQDLDFTVQLSVSSIHPESVKYCAQIEAPANGLAPITWVTDSYEELEKALKKAERNLDQKAVEKAFLASQIKAAEEKQKFFEEKLKELEGES